MTAAVDTLPDDPETLKAMLLASQARAARLEQIIKELQRHHFGRRAEKLPEDQLLLALEDVEQGVAHGEAEADAADPNARPRRAAKRRANRGSLPAHLPRVEMVVDIEDHACPCCQNALHRIGEDVSERLDIVPAQLRVLVVRRPKYVRRRFYELATAGPAPIASEALERIAKLYAIESGIRGRGAEDRRAVRREQAKPLVDELESWLRAKLELISQKTKLAEAIRYALSRWTATLPPWKPILPRVRPQR